MVVGFNHNFLYKGEVYHIQTEDSGRNSPNIVTLLYHGGTILASKKTSYADIAKVSNLEQVVEELMKEQHKEMLRSLKAGEFDAQIARFEASRAGKKEPVAPSAPPPAPAKLPAAPAQTPTPPPQPTAAPVVTPAPAPAPSAAKAPVEQKSPAVETSLDEIILSYLMGKGD